VLPVARTPLRGLVFLSASGHCSSFFNPGVPSFENQQLNGNEKVHHHSATKYPTELVAHVRPRKAVLNQYLFF